jgi:pimeloyl-ACP methyl ester carboxylesterase
MKKTIIAAISFAILGLGGCANLPYSEKSTKVESVMSSDYVKFSTIGQGKDIILIPGLGSPPDVYDGIKDKLAKNYRVHIIHVKGYAGLPFEKNEGEIFNNVATAIGEYIKTYDLNDIAIIGHSMGGELAMAINARNAGKVSKVLVVDAFTYYSLLLNPNATPQNMTPQATGFRAMFKAMNDETYKAQQVVSIARLVKSEEKRKQVLDWSINSNRHAIAQGLYDLMTIDLRPELKDNKAKITLIYAYDPMMGLTQEKVDGLYQNVYKDIPNTNLKRIDNSLHFIMYDQPQAFENAVDEFLK